MYGYRDPSVHIQVAFVIRVLGIRVSIIRGLKKEYFPSLFAVLSPQLPEWNQWFWYSRLGIFSNVSPRSVVIRKHRYVKKTTITSHVWSITDSNLLYGLSLIFYSKSVSYADKTVLITNMAQRVFSKSFNGVWLHFWVFLDKGQYQLINLL